MRSCVFFCNWFSLIWSFVPCQSDTLQQVRMIWFLYHSSLFFEDKSIRHLRYHHHPSPLTPLFLLFIPSQHVQMTWTRSSPIFWITRTRASSFHSWKVLRARAFSWADASILLLRHADYNSLSFQSLWWQYNVNSYDKNSVILLFVTLFWPFDNVIICHCDIVVAFPFKNEASIHIVSCIKECCSFIRETKVRNDGSIFALQTVSALCQNSITAPRTGSPTSKIN